MTTRTDEAKATILEAAVSRARALSGTEADDVERWVRTYYAHVAPEDLADRTDADLAGAALAHWSLAQQRRPGELKVRVYNPNVEEHGWESPHTVVEFVNDDMPFLVDSISMEITRHGSGIHLMIRPIVRVRRDDEGEPRGDRRRGRHPRVDDPRRARPADRPAGARASCATTSSACSATSPPRSPTGRRCWRRRARSPRTSRSTPPPVDPEELSETIDLLEWMRENFTFLGYREYEIADEDGEEVLRAVPGSGLGILRQKGGGADLGQLRAAAARRAAHGAAQAPAQPDEGELARDRASPGVPRLHRRQALRRARRGRRRAALPRAVHAHRVQRDAVGDPRDPPQGAARAGALRACRTAATTTRRSSTSSRRIRATSCCRSPRTTSSRSRWAIFQLGERRRVRLFVRRDNFGRFLSCLVYIPRDRFNTRNRERIEEILDAGARTARRSTTGRV